MRYREQTDATTQQPAEGVRRLPSAPALGDDHALRGLDFASQDCLGLSTHPEIVAAAADVLRRFGVRSVCAAAEAGDPGLAVALERRIADFLQMETALLCPTGRAAARTVIRGLVRPADHVVIDAAIRGGLRDDAEAATDNLQPFRHLDADHCRDRLQAIRARDARNGILVVTESLSPLDSGTPDLAALRALCDEFGATLLVDVAQDLGCLGEDGRGHLGLQDMLGKADLVIGSFSKSFASNGGFVAARTRAVTACLRAGETEQALSPIQLAVILKAFAIIGVAEGSERRARLMRNVLNLRTALRERALSVCGEPCTSVSVEIGFGERARCFTHHLSEFGLLADLAGLEETGRLRLHVTAGHSDAEVARAAACVAAALDRAQADLSRSARRTRLRAAA
ncbi:class I/II aminotransferase [Methylorubrum populi]|uniref:8-amino-7-oxononanoate synthase n=1 Tax=Methylorubrum populi TaxID=223967 RepID=A0A160PAI8_9HYPH|nr:pyridoxal phosphate-dependent aminotransferase family protein [Methylorubrum populi]BAU89176.1 class I/II aminotransferase [Methylorubrum populi]